MEKNIKKTNYYEENKNDIDFQKITDKANLMRSANSNALRKKYVNLWYDEETKYYRKVRQRDDRIIIFLVRHRLFFLIQIIDYHVFGVPLYWKIKGMLRAIVRKHIKKRFLVFRS
jgi:hypothetical protein